MSLWIPLGEIYPPFDKKVLVTDGESWQIRILMKDKKGRKFWKTDHNVNLRYSASHWMELPEVPE